MTLTDSIRRYFAPRTSSDAARELSLHRIACEHRKFIDTHTRLAVELGREDLLPSLRYRGERG